MTVERVEKRLNRLTETTELRLTDLERAVGQLNAMFVTLRVAKLNGRLEHEDSNGGHVWSGAVRPSAG